METRVTWTIYSVAGVLAAYWAANRLTRKKALPGWMIGISDCCMGVYVFQQFVLVGLYYHSPFPSLCGAYALPWAGFAVAATASFAAARLARKTKAGRFLLG